MKMKKAKLLTKNEINRRIKYILNSCCREEYNVAFIS